MSLSETQAEAFSSNFETKYFSAESPISISGPPLEKKAVFPSISLVSIMPPSNKSITFS